MPLKFLWIVAGVSIAAMALTAIGMSAKPEPELTIAEATEAEWQSPGAVAFPRNSQFKPVIPGQPSQAARIRVAKLEIIQRTLIELEQEGYHMDPVNVGLAMDDAPEARGYVVYAYLPRVVAQSEMDRNDPPNMRAACFSMPTPYIADHLIVKADAHRVLKYGSDFHGWIVSGCADAIRTRGQTISMAQMRVILRDMYPDTPEYAEQRREMLTQLNSQPTRRYIRQAPPRPAYTLRPVRIRSEQLPR